MPSRLIRLATGAWRRVADQSAALENARVAATLLAQARIDRLEVEHYLERHWGARWTGEPRLASTSRGPGAFAGQRR